MRQAESISQFCDWLEISPASFYRHRADMPRLTKIGGQFRILPEDKAEWIQKKREEAAANPDAPSA